MNPKTHEGYDTYQAIDSQFQESVTDESTSSSIVRVNTHSLVLNFVYFVSFVVPSDTV